MGGRRIMSRLGRLLLVERFLVQAIPGLLEPLRLLLDSTGVRVLDCDVGAGGGGQSDNCFELELRILVTNLLRLPLSMVFFRCQ